MIKTAVKQLVYLLVPKKNGFSDLRVMSGPAKGAILRLDVRVNGSYWLGNYDQWIFDRVKFDQYIKPGDVVWDCGAYVGYYTATFRKIAGEKGKVHTFEASADNYETLKALPGNNKWSNVNIHYLAVGPDHTELQFVNNLQGSSGPYGLGKNYRESAAELSLSKVACSGVDELVFERGIDMPDFIKFDLESAEEFALHNGDRVFKEKRPVILLELHGPKTKEAAGLFFEKYNYKGLLLHEMPDIKNEIRSREDFNKVEGVPHMVLCIPC
jgi:FkbM family methyltransferase